MNAILPVNRGVYILANDLVYDLVVAFLNSLRASNPAIPLCLIPFDSCCDRLMRLRATFHFSVFSDDSILAQCDEISTRFHHKVLGHYRKLAAWFGVFDEFLYIDVDTIVLSSFDFAFSFLKDATFISAYSNLSRHKRFVWKTSIDSVNILTPSEIEYSANTGFFVSKAGLFDFSFIHAQAMCALRIRDHLELNCLIVTIGCRYTSLLTLHNLVPQGDIPLEAWVGGAGRFSVVASGNDFYLLDRTNKRRLYKVLFIHWANKWRPTKWDKRIDAFLRIIRIQNESRSIRRFLGWGKTWRHFRFLTVPQHTHR
jgi:hypothetical protein